MTEKQSSILYSYEENEWVTAELEKILTENISGFKKIKRMRELKSKLSTPISRQHTEYYLKKDRADIRRRIEKFICVLMVTAYLIFTLFRVYWYYNPELNPLDSSKSLNLTDLIVLLYLVPVVFVVRFILKRLVKRVSR